VTRGSAPTGALYKLLSAKLEEPADDLLSALADIEFQGQVIKAGDGVIMPNDIGNRDPGVFTDPDKLNITRDAKNHLAFSFGPHQCLGQPLATTVQLNFKNDVSIYGVFQLPVTWD
jgi:hypothetical protein